MKKMIIGVLVTGLVFGIFIVPTVFADGLTKISEIELDDFVEHVAISGTTVIATAGRHIYSINIACPENPTVVFHYKSTTTRYTGVKTKGKYVFAITNNGVEVYRLDSKKNLTKISELEISSFNCEVYATYISSDKLYVCYRYCGIDIISISDPENPVFLGNQFSGDKVWSVCQKGVDLYVGANDALFRLKNDQEVGSIQLSGQIRAIFVLPYENGNLTVLTEGMAYKIKPNLKIVASGPFFLWPSSFAIWGTRAYLASPYGWAELQRGVDGNFQTYYDLEAVVGDVAVNQGLVVFAAKNVVIMQ